MNYYIAVPKNYKLYNGRTHDVWKKILNDPQTIQIPCNSSAEIISFIEENKDASDKTLLIYEQNATPFVLDLVNHVNTYTTLQLRIIFFTFDYWWGKNCQYAAIWKIIYYAKNHHVITFASDIDNLNMACGKELNSYQNNIHYFNLWCCYDTSFLPFNEDPVINVAVSGNIDINYPEREQMLKIPGVIRMPFITKEVHTNANNYNKRLNTYLCCFASSVHVKKYPHNEYFNTHVILLKYFEILASGSLLLCPDTEKSQLLEMGLQSDIHYIATSNYAQSVEWILNPQNRIKVDCIRKAGQEYARENLNSTVRYEQLMDLLNKI